MHCSCCVAVSALKTPTGSMGSMALTVTHQPALVCVRAVHCVSARVCTLLLEPGPIVGSCGLPLRHSPGCSPRICSRPAQPGGFTAPAVSQLWLRPFLGSAAPSKTFVFLSVPSWVCQGSVLWCGSGRGPTLPLSTFSSIICFPDEHFCTFSHTVTKG